MIGPEFGREGLLRVVVTTTCAGLLAWFVSGLPTAHADFAMLWTALRQTNPYDYETLKATLNWGPTVAFPYPPSSLPIFGLFALLPYRAALIAWAATSGAALGLVSQSRWTPFLLLVPPVLWALPGGQTSVLLGSILFGALLLLSRKPIAAGALIGLAVALKPQLSIVLPLALLIERKWTPLIAATATFVAFTVISAVVFGSRQWIDWAESLRPFLALHEAIPILQRNEIAAGLPLWLRALALACGVWLTARALRKGDLVEAFVMAVGSALIASAHAMGYEFAMFAPVYVSLVRRRAPAGLAAAGFILTPALIWALPGLLIYMPRLIAVIMLMACVAHWSRRESRKLLLVRGQG